LPDDILQNYLSAEEISNFRNSELSVRSITVYGEKPANKVECCGTDCC